MKPLLLALTVAGLTACAPPTKPQPFHAPAPVIVITPAPVIVEHKVEALRNEPIKRTLERAQWHTDYAKGLIKQHRAKEGLK
jgi:hypothetical protein